MCLICFLHIKGDPGLQGIQGKSGLPANCRLDEALAKTCSSGPTGPTGIKGSIGPEGGVGATGTKGDTGEDGEKGDQGRRGPPGKIGPHGTMETLGSCKELYTEWVIPNSSPIGKLKTRCKFREFLQSLAIEQGPEGNSIRYKYKCCPFLAESIRTTRPGLPPLPDLPPHF